MRLTGTVAIFLLVSTVAFSATIHVPGNYSSIQDAILAANAGDTILVAPGTYRENIDFLGKAINVVSEKGALVTAIDGASSGSVAAFVSGETATSVLDGFTLFDGSGTNHAGFFCGGGIYCSGSSPTITNNTITGNSAYRGGGIFCSFSSPAISRNTITGNSASDVGGGICCRDQSSPPISGNAISKNMASYGGGIECNTSSSPTIASNNIRGNTASGSFVLGGGIYCEDSSPNIVNNTVSGNRVVGTIHAFGGGITCYTASSPTITNNTIVGNEVTAAGPAYGGGMLCLHCTPVVANCIFYDNIAKSGSEICVQSSINPAVVTIDFSDVEGGQANCLVENNCTLNWGTSMILADPLFADGASGDFHLTWNSPCRNAGDNAAVSIQLDQEGDPRIAQKTVDMGADEFYTRLYTIGDVLPGATIDMKVVGLPGFPVKLALGSAIQDPPWTTQHGSLWLKLPVAKSWNLGATQADGLLVQPMTVPSGWVAGSERPFQALVGTWGGTATRLTNLLALRIE